VGEVVSSVVLVEVVVEDGVVGLQARSYAPVRPRVVMLRGGWMMHRLDAVAGRSSSAGCSSEGHIACEAHTSAAVRQFSVGNAPVRIAAWSRTVLGKLVAFAVDGTPSAATGEQVHEDLVELVVWGMGLHHTVGWDSRGW
jgi:hypothetical protein